MTHLSAAELKAWYEEGKAADRSRVMAHLAECGECRRALSALAMVTELETGTPAIQPAEAIPQGYAAHRQPSASTGRLSWMRPAYGLAAAAVVLLAVAWVVVPRGHDGSDVVRSGELVALSPAGNASTLEFKWESPFAASKYRLVIRDAAGTQVFSGETTEAGLSIDATARARFATMVDYSWTVSALDAMGEVIAESKPRSFTYQP
jgi:predicted anti-sigma-YlaC factor YlaD